MALAPIFCEKGKHRISPATALKEVNGEIWCENCVVKSVEDTRVENNPCAEIGNYYKSINLDLEKAQWLLRFEPNGKSLISSYLWLNKPQIGIPDKYIVEILMNGDWKLWWYNTNMSWQQQLTGNYAAWLTHWPHIDAQYSPK